MSRVEFSNLIYNVESIALVSVENDLLINCHTMFCDLVASSVFIKEIYFNNKKFKFQSSGLIAILKKLIVLNR